MGSYEDPFGWRLSMEGSWDEQLSAPALSMAGDLRSMNVETPRETPEQVNTRTSSDKENPRYEKISILGQGGMGRVWLGWDTKLERHVAIKEPLEGLGSITHQRLMREVYLTAQLEHPGVVAIHDVYSEDERAHFVMALVRGETLARKLSGFNPDDDAERARLLAHILEVCDVISHAHRHCVIHRDLSPRNILITESGNARVIDWGLAISLEEAINPHGSAGTPGYASPEQQKGGVLGTRSDVWSIGALLHSVLHGAPPDQPSRRKTGLNPELEAICDRALSHDPRDRYSDASTMGEDLRRWFEGRLVQAYDVTPWRLVRRFARIHRVPLFFATVALLASSGALAWGVANTKREATRAKIAEAQARERAEQAQHTAAILHGESAKINLVKGDYWAAHQDIKASLEHRQDPEHIGLAMRASLASLPRKLSEQRLPHCGVRWHLSNRPDALVCQDERFLLKGFDGEKFTWETATDPLYIRIKENTFELLNSSRERWTYSLESGKLLAQDPRMGHFIAPRRADAISVGRNGWLDAPNLQFPCEETATSGWLSDDRKLSYVQCHGGDIYRVQEDSVEIIDKARIKHIHHMILDNRGNLWGADVKGRLERVGTKMEILDFGEPFAGIENIPGTGLILVVSQNGNARILDPIGHRWVTSFPGDARDVRVTHDGKIMRLTRDGYLELWEVPVPTIPVYGGQHGLSKNDISVNNDIVSAVDGGGYIHMFEPFTGKIYEPYKASIMVGKSVANSYRENRRFYSSNMDLQGYLVLSTDNGAVIEEARPNQSPRLSRRILAFADESKILITYDTGFSLYDEASNLEDIHMVYKDFFEGALNIDGTEALLLERTGAWLYKPRETPRSFIQVEGLTDGDFSNDGEIALLHKTHVTIHDQETGEELTGFPLPSRAVSIAWRPGKPHIVTGHLDGSVYVWDREGKPLAESKHHGARLSEVTISTDGKFMATSSWDSTTHVLSFEPLDEILARDAQ